MCRILDSAIAIVLTIVASLFFVFPVWGEGGYSFVTKWGSLGSAIGQFDHPMGIAVSNSGDVYVMDSYNVRIQKFTPVGTFITSWSAGVNIGIDVDPWGNVYATGGGLNAVYKYTGDGALITAWGGMPGGRNDGQFYEGAVGVAINASGDVFVTDIGDNRVQKFNSEGNFLLKWGIETGGHAGLPFGIAVDSSNNVYVADSGWGSVQKFTSDGSFILEWGQQGDADGELRGPGGITVDKRGNVYVADSENNRIQKFSSNGSFITKWGSYGSGDGQFFYPADVAVDSSGNVYVVDFYNNRIQTFAPSCGCSLSPQSYAYNAQGGTGMVTVTTSPSNCYWTATSNDSWIHITSGSTFTGNGTVSYYVDPNTTGIARRGTTVIGVEAFTVRQAPGTFIDDPQNALTPYINAIYAEGITLGCGGTGYYCLSDPVTRSSMAVFIVRAIFGENFIYSTAPYFMDVPPEYGAFKYIQKFRDANITQVVGTYDINGVVTRGQMAVFIVRSLFGDNFTYTTTPYFTDVPPEYGAFKYIQKFRDANITQVVGTYNVDQPVTRDQMAVFLSRAFLRMQ